MVKKKKPQPPKEYQFKKGVSGNKGGRPKIPDHLRTVDLFSPQELKYLISQYFRKTKQELYEAITGADTPAFEQVLAATLTIAAKRGDFSGVDRLLDRLVGKVTDKIEHSAPRPTLITFSDGEKILLDRSEGE